jgi:peptidyl-prolyl cis-trans isomerase SurA
MKRFLSFALLLALVASPAYAQRVTQLRGIAPTATAAGTGIAAVVNDNVITTTDLENRMKLAILSSGLTDSPEVRAHLLPQILRSLIDEQLQNQEAKRLDLSVGEDEINKALDRIATDNHIPGNMKEFIASHGGSPEALIDQIRGGLLWNKVIQRELRPKVDVGDDEIDAVVERVRANAGKQEFLVSEIYLAIDNPKDEEQIHQVAENLGNQLKKGANFSAIARQFSQGAGAAQGGDIGWIGQGQLAPELNKALSNAEPGEISDPIRTTNGYHILGVRDKRTVSLGDPDKASINLTQAFRAYSPTVSKDKALQEAGHLRATVKGCADLDSVIAASFPGWKTQKLGAMNPAKAPAWLADKVRGVPSGASSQPLPTDKGAAVLFVCGRNDGGDIDREAIMHSIGTEKLELQARRLLRDLHRSAYLDIRLGKNG